MIDKWQKRFELIRGFGWIALAGAVAGVVAIFTSGEVQKWACIFAVLFILPAFFYTYVVTLWHWKDRYRGDHSDLWGALILLETSGWMKVVYLFRHLIPDMRKSRQYKTVPVRPPAGPPPMRE